MENSDYSKVLLERQVNSLTEEVRRLKSLIEAVGSEEMVGRRSGFHLRGFTIRKLCGSYVIVHGGVEVQNETTFEEALQYVMDVSSK